MRGRFLMRAGARHGKGVFRRAMLGETTATSFNSFKIAERGDAGGRAIPLPAVELGLIF